MIRQNSQEAPASLFENREEITSLHYLGDDMRSQLIQGYQLAVERGLPPCDALAIVLSWAADEACRLGANYGVLKSS